MSGKNPTDPLELFQISKELLAARQRYLPSSHVYAQVAEVMRSVTQANITYVQALMRANAALLAAFMERPDGAVTEELPSAAAHRPDTTAP